LNYTRMNRSWLTSAFCRFCVFRPENSGIHWAEPVLCWELILINPSYKIHLEADKSLFSDSKDDSFGRPFSWLYSKRPETSALSEDLFGCSAD